MLTRYHVSVLVLLAGAFIGIAVLKYDSGAGGQRNSPQASQHADSLAEADQFWTLYREATDARTDGHYERAVRLYRKALDRRPGHRDARFYLGGALFRAGRLEEAGQRWRELFEEYPGSARVRGQLAGLRMCSERPNQHDLNRAKRHFRAIVRLHGEETEPLVRLTQILVVQDSLDRARDALAPLAERGALPAEAAFLRGYLAWRADRSRMATVNLARARRALSPDTTQKSPFRVPPAHQNEVCRVLSEWRSTLKDVPPGQIETTDTYTRFRQALEQVRGAS